jgi:nucleoid DNA-binding protein
MTKADIVDRIAKGTGLTRKETAAVVDGFLSMITFALQSGERIELRGFGTFCLRHRRKKVVANPKTGVIMQIPDRICPDFKPSPHLKAAVARELKESEKVLPDPAQSQTELFSEMDKYFIDEYNTGKEG